jgi:hypothetical protein
MSLNAINKVAQDAEGNLMAGASVAIRQESDSALIVLWEDAAGTVAAGNPYTTADGVITLWAETNKVKITAMLGSTVSIQRDVIIGMKAEYVDYDGGNAKTALDASLQTVATLAGLLAIPSAGLVTGAKRIVSGYFNGWAAYLTKPKGGGVFVCDTARLKSEHDGGCILSSTVPWDGLAGASHSAFLLGTGETDPGGTGLVWVRDDFAVTPAEFGADETNNATPSLNAYTASMKALTNNFVFNDSYRLDGMFELTELVNASVTFSNGCKFTRTTKTSPAMRLSCRHTEFKGMLYTAFDSSLTITGSDTSAVGLQTDGIARSSFDAIKIENVYDGIRTNQVGGFTSGTQNIFFSNTINRTDISGWVNWAIDIDPFDGGNTGSVWNNTYLNNKKIGIAADCVGFVRFSTLSESVFNQLNLEHGNPTSGLLRFASDCETLCINGLHIEGVTPKNDFNGLVDLGNSVSLTINGFVNSNSIYSDANVSNFAVCRLGENSNVTINGFSELSGTVTGTPTISKVRYNSAVVTKSKVTFNDTNGFGVFTGTQQNVPATMVSPYRNGDKRLPLIEVAASNASAAAWSVLGGADITIFNTAITADRNANTLDASIYQGATRRIVRTTAATGAFNVLVKQEGTTIFTIPAPTTDNLYVVIMYVAGAWLVMETNA